MTMKKRVRRIIRGVKMIDGITGQKVHSLAALQVALGNAKVKINWPEVIAEGNKLIKRLAIEGLNPFESFGDGGQEGDPQAQSGSMPSWGPEAIAAIVILLVVADGPLPAGDIAAAIFVGAVVDAGLDGGNGGNGDTNGNGEENGEENGGEEEGSDG